MMVAALAACGGGGGDDGGSGAAPPPPAAPPASSGTTLGGIENTQAKAGEAVSVVNANVADIAKAAAAGVLPGGSHILTLPSGATLTGSYPCGTSGNVSYTYNYDATTGRPQSYEFRYNACVYTFGGTTVTYSGTGTLNYTRWNSATDWEYTYTYDFSYSYRSATYNADQTINTQMTCTHSGNATECAYSFGSNRVRNVTATTSGNVTTVTRATISSTNNITIVYDNWVYDASLRRATSGSVTISDASGNSIVVTATGTGYTVRITYNGTTTTYTVSFG
jgi:hypothetical protein